MNTPNLFFPGKRVLITGGLGFIGSNMASRLLDLGANVTLVDSLVPEYGGNLHNVEGIRGRCELHITDIRDEFSIAYHIRDKDVIFNLAGQTSHMDSMKNPFTDLDINCRAQLSLLEACRRNNPSAVIVFASTRQLYGKPDFLPVPETHPIRPVDVNGINKMAGEAYHLLYHSVYRIQTCCLRLTNTIGPRMRIKDTRQTFLGIWIRTLLEGKPFEVWGGQQIRDFTYVDDAVEAFLLAAANTTAHGKVFNLGGPPPVSLKDLADLLIAANGSGGYRIQEFPADRKPIDIGDYQADDSRIRAELGWSPKTSLPEALTTTLEYYRFNLKHYL